MGLLRLVVRAFVAVIDWQERRDSRRTAVVARVEIERTVVVPPPVQALPRGTILRGRCWVVDGDTIIIENHNIRLAGIDAPELDHPWGQNAKWAMIRLCRGKAVRAEIVGELSYNRQLAYCFLPDGRDLGAEMVKQGLALDWAKFSGGRYRRFEPADARRRLWRADARQKGRYPAVLQ